MLLSELFKKLVSVFKEASQSLILIFLLPAGKNLKSFCACSESTDFIEWAFTIYTIHVSTTGKYASAIVKESNRLV
jgi:hypothetical protein